MSRYTVVKSKKKNENLGFNHQVMFKTGYNINMGYGQATSLYAILYHAICSN